MLVWMTIVLGTNLLFSFLPCPIGDFVFSLIQRENPIKPPKDIKVSERSFKRAKAPDINPRHLRTDVQEERLANEAVERLGLEGRAPWLKWSTTNQE